MTTITDSATLADTCARFKKAEFVTVDTEFLRESTYWSKLCLIQMASDDEAVAIDPLADDMDLAPFFELMADKNVLKVLHAARQDLEIFFKLSGALPTPLFDTQVAAMVCGFGDSVGYETLVTKITKRPLDKSHRYTDWSRRPLTEAQLDYAIGDVTHLRDVYRFLAHQLEATSRHGWLEEEMELLTSPNTYQVVPAEAWLRLRPRTNKPRFLGLLREIAAWREEVAQAKDIPRSRVVRDEVLFEIAAHPPREPEALEKIRGIPKGFTRSRRGKTLLAAVERALQLDESELPVVEKTKHRPATPPMADLLKVLLKTKCVTERVAPRLVASTQEIEAWAAEPHKDFRFLHGWRAEIFGRDARNLMKGSLALTSHNGEIDVVEIDPA